MFEENNKIQVSIYQIDKTLFEKNDSFDTVVDSIISSFNIREANVDSRFIPQKISKEYKDFDIRIFYAAKSRIPKWRGFLQDTISPDSELSKASNKDASFITFIDHEDNIYAVSGGLGNFTVQEYVNQNFGMEVLSRLIEKDNKVIKALQERGVTGTVLGSTKFFRADHKLSDEDQFGKIYKIIKADLSKKILIDELGLDEDDVKRKSGCLAKSSFQINKSIVFDELLEIIKKIDILLRRDEKFSLNKVKMIPNRGKKNKELVTHLNFALINDLYTKCQAKQNLDFDFCHKDFDNFLTASCYVVKRGREEILNYPDDFNLEILIEDLENKKLINLATEKDFTESFLELNIQSFGEDDKKLTAGSVIEHIHGEIIYGEKTYFYIDSSWYEINPKFIEDLDKECIEILKEYSDDSLLPITFDDGETENTFNSKMLGQEGCLVLDKILPENIESCDILKYDANFIYMIHVKKGFDCSVRDLASQISISAKRILEDKKSGYGYIDLLESMAKSGATSTETYRQNVAKQTFPSPNLKSLFKKRKEREIIFCFAVLDTAKTNRLLQNQINLFDSNIAKFSLIELRREINSLGFGFRVIQIKKTP
jgi:uncharacterized protein (TIGR04141 family)